MSATNIQQRKKCHYVWLHAALLLTAVTAHCLPMICRLQRSFVCFVFLFSVALVLKQYGSSCQSNIDKINSTLKTD